MEPVIRTEWPSAFGLVLGHGKCREQTYCASLWICYIGSLQEERGAAVGAGGGLVGKVDDPLLQAFLTGDYSVHGIT